MFPAHHDEWENPYKYHAKWALIFLVLSCVLFPSAYILHMLQVHWMFVAAVISSGVYTALMSLHNNIDGHHYFTRWKLFGKPSVN